ncbi:MAG: TraB/GumN family protein [Bacteroidota bacterium]
MKSRFASFLFLISFFLVIQAQTPQYNSLLWEISGNGLSKPSYLYGTMHVSEKLAFHLGDPFFNAIQNADVVALEVNPTTWLDDMLHSEYYKAGMNNNEDYSYGTARTVYPFRIKVDRIESFKTMLSEDPEMLNNLMFRMTYGMEEFEEDTYLDMYIYKTAMKKGKEVYGIQKLDDLIQASIDAEIDRITRKDKKKYKSYDYDSDGNRGDNIEDAYRKQDLNLLDSLSGINADESFQEYILYKRNIIMANFIDSIVKNNKSLFTGVGAAHLPGQKGVIELLRAMGYTVNPIDKGERNASVRDKMDNTILPIKFNSYTTSDAELTFSAPNIVEEVNSTGLSNTYLSSDLVNGMWYLCMRETHQRGLDFKTVDEVKKELKDYIYEYVPGKIVSQKTISINGQEATSIVNLTRKGDYQRIVLMITDEEVIMFKAGGIKDIKKDEMGTTFINSIQYNKNTTSTSPVTYTYFTGEFSIQMPHKPIYYKSKVDTTLLSTHCLLHSYDEATKTNYVLQKAAGQMYLYIEADSFILNDILNSGIDPLKTELISKRYGLYKGKNAVFATYKNDKNEFTQAMGVIYELDRYLLRTISLDSTKYDQSFFNSLNFLQPYAYSKFTPFTDTSLHVSSVIPYKESTILDQTAMIRKAKRKLKNAADAHSDEKGYYPTNFNGYIAIDALEYPKYFSIADTGIYLKDQRVRITRDGEMILKSEKCYQDAKGILHQEFILTDTASKAHSFITVLLCKNTRYTLYAQSDSIIPNNYIQQFYSHFQIIDTALKGNSIFINHSDLWFEDAMSKDSTTKENAFDLITSLQPKKTDASKLIQVFENEVPKTDEYIYRRANLIQKMGLTNDTTILPFLKKIYTQYSDSSLYQFAVLHALLKMNTKSANDLFSQLLTEELPLSNESSVIDDLFYEIEDSLKSKKDLIPALLSISSNEDYKPALYDLLSYFLDSNIITPKTYESIKNTMLNDAKVALRKYISGDAMDALDQGDIYIYNLSKLLASFYSQESVQPFFTKGLTQTFDLVLQADFAVVMQKNKINVPDSIHRALLSEKYIRPYYILQLQKNKISNKVDSTYFQPDTIAKTMFYYMFANRYEEPDSFKLIRKVLMNTQFNRGYIYFFAYKPKDSEGEWQYNFIGSISDKAPNYLVENNTDFDSRYLGLDEDDKPSVQENKLNQLVLKIARGENIINHSYDELYEKEGNYYFNTYSYDNYKYNYDYDDY